MFGIYFWNGCQANVLMSPPPLTLDTISTSHLNAFEIHHSPTMNETNRRSAYGQSEPASASKRNRDFDRDARRHNFVSKGRDLSNPRDNKRVRYDYNRYDPLYGRDIDAARTGMNSLSKPITFIFRCYTSQPKPTKLKQRGIRSKSRLRYDARSHCRTGDVSQVYMQ